MQFSAVHIDDLRRGSCKRLVEANALRNPAAKDPAPRVLPRSADVGDSVHLQLRPRAQNSKAHVPLPEAEGRHAQRYPCVAEAQRQHTRVAALLGHKQGPPPGDAHTSPVCEHRDAWDVCAVSCVSQSFTPTERVGRHLEECVREVWLCNAVTVTAFILLFLFLFFLVVGKWCLTPFVCDDLSTAKNYDEVHAAILKPRKKGLPDDYTWLCTLLFFSSSSLFFLFLCFSVTFCIFFFFFSSTHQR